MEILTVKKDRKRNRPKVHLMQTVQRELLGSTISASDLAGNKLGAGYVTKVVNNSNGDRLAQIRLIISGIVFIATVNWDLTRFCELEVSMFELELVRNV